MYYRVVVDGFCANNNDLPAQFGEIKSRHNDYFAATKALQKAKRQGNGLFNVAVVELKSLQKLEVGDFHASLVWEAYRDERREAQVASCADVIESLKTGAIAEEVCKRLYLQDEFGEEMDFSSWCERFTQDAQQKLELRQLEKQQQAERNAKLASTVASFDKAAAELTYTFPAVKGIQARREYYIAQVPFKYLVRFFKFADETLSADERAQRKVNQKHAKDIADYVTMNRDDYVLPSITASVNSAMMFESASVNGLADRLGILHIPLDATILVNDGQHRLSSATDFMKVDPSLGDETISVVFYYDEGLQRSQQMFADLNANLSKPSSAINMLYDLRNPFNAFVVDALASFTKLNELVDKEQTTIGAKSTKVWSLVHWKKFCQKLLGLNDKGFAALEPEQVAEATHKVTTTISGLLDHLPTWGQVANGDITPEDLRKEHVSGYAVYLESVAVALAGVDTEDLTAAIEQIATLDASKDADHWQGRCVAAGRMDKSVDAVRVTAALMRQTAQVPLDDKLIEACERHNLTLS